MAIITLKMWENEENTEILDFVFKSIETCVDFSPVKNVFLQWEHSLNDVVYVFCAHSA
jgi:hypothetical protein